MFSWEVQKQHKPKGRGWTKNSSAHVLYVHRCNPRTLSARCLAGMHSFFWVSRDQSRTSQRRNVFTSYGTNTSNKAHKSQYIMDRDLTHLKPYRHMTVLCDVKLQAGRAACFKKRPSTAPLCAVKAYMQIKYACKKIWGLLCFWESF